MRKHLSVLASIIVALALAGCSSEPEPKEQTETSADSPSATASESADPTEDSTTTEQPTASQTSDPSASACEFDDDWSTTAKIHEGEPLNGDIMSKETTDMIYSIETGRHDCFDRVVVRIDSVKDAGFRAEYVDTVHTPGKGDPVDILGDGDLRVLVRAWTFNTPELNWLNIKSPRWPVLKQVVQAGSFEGQTTIAIGVDEQRPFRAFALPTDDGKGRIVIDIAHQ